VSSSAPAQVSVWHAHIDVLVNDAARAARALEWLSADERTRYSRYRHTDDRLMFLLGRVMTRALVGRAIGRPPTGWRWQHGPRGRPEVGDADVALRFNVAHSAGLVVCALADDREVGVDVEDRQRRPLDRNIVRRFCAPAEVDDIDACGENAWHDRFLTYWTLKEAYLKARGLGIAVHLADVNLAIDGDGARLSFLGGLAGTDTRWVFRLAAPTPRHLLAVAAPVASGPVTFAIAPTPLEWLP
jgi:4'-phosphopantetheinyl transferase